MKCQSSIGRALIKAIFLTKRLTSLCSRDNLDASLNGFGIVMSCVELLTALIAGREFEVRNLHVKHKQSAIVGYSFDLYFADGEVNNYATTGHELKEITELLVRNF